MCCVVVYCVAVNDIFVGSSNANAINCSDKNVIKIVTIFTDMDSTGFKSGHISNN